MSNRQVGIKTKKPLKVAAAKDTCGTCEATIDDKTEGSIQCNFCCEWIHDRCCNIPSDVFDKLPSIGEALYFKCQSCIKANSKKVPVIAVLEKVSKLQEDNAKMMKDILESIGGCNSSYLKLEDDVIALRDEIDHIKAIHSRPTPVPQMPKTRCPDDSQSTNCALNCFQNHPTHISSDRAHNVIIYNVPDDQDPVSASNEILSHLKIPLHNIVNAIRIGKSNPKWSRPIKLATINHVSAQCILDRAKSLITFKKYDSSIYLKSDFTMEQREIERKKLKERRELLDKGIKCRLKGLEIIIFSDPRNNKEIDSSDTQVLNENLPVQNEVATSK